jgi:nucleoside-triphosphatase THEP1
MPTAVLIVGGMGEGKTRACLKLAERCEGEGIKVYGMVSPRVYQGGRLMGYDGLDLSTRVRFPLARLREVAEGPDWFEFGGLRYAFSKSGFERANSILLSSSEASIEPSIIFIDEFGRLEAAGRGLHSGILRVLEGMRRGGAAVFTCRTDIRNSLEKLLRERGVKLLCYGPSGLEEIWTTIQRLLIHSSTGVGGFSVPHGPPTHPYRVLGPCQGRGQRPLSPWTRRIALSPPAGATPPISA